VELPDEVALVRQAEDRAHRKGQRSAVNVYFLCARNTCDDKRWQRLNQSLCQITQVHDGLPDGGPGGGGGGAAAGSGGGGGSGGGAAAAAAAAVAAGRPALGLGLVVDRVLEVAPGGADGAAALGLPTQAPAATQAGATPPPAATPPGQAAAAAGGATPAGGDSEPRPSQIDTPLSGADQGAAAAAPAAPSTPPPGAAAGRTPAGGGAATGGAGGAGATPCDPIDLTADSPERQPPTSSARRRQASSQQQPGSQSLPPQAGSQRAVPRGPAANQGRVASALGAAAAQPGGAPAPEVWFEVSPFTSRLHFHLAADGGCPLGLSLPLELLTLQREGCSPMVEEIIRKWPQPAAAGPQQQQAAGEERQRQQQDQQQQEERRAAAHKELGQQQQQQQEPEPGGAAAAAGGEEAQVPRPQPQLSQPAAAATPLADALAAALSSGAGGSSNGRRPSRGSARSALCSLLSPPLPLGPRAAPSQQPEQQQGQPEQPDEQGEHDQGQPVGPASSRQEGTCAEGQPQQEGDALEPPGAGGGSAVKRRRVSRAGSAAGTPGFVAATPLGDGAAGAAVGMAAAEAATPGVVAATPLGADAAAPPSSCSKRQRPAAAAGPPSVAAAAAAADPAAAAAFAAELPPDPPRGPPCRGVAGFMGPIGVVAPAAPLARGQLEELVAEARAFAGDWGELRPVTRNRLHGRVLPSSLQDAVEAISAAAASAGALGVGTDRYLLPMEARSLPDGVVLREVAVRYPGARRPLARYRQPFVEATGVRLCLHCLKEVPDCEAPADAVLEGGVDLFCGLDCERAYYIKSSSGGCGLMALGFGLLGGARDWLQCALLCLPKVWEWGAATGRPSFSCPPP
jgi:hypothetical protein